MRVATLLGILAATAVGAPTGELLREEPFNYRVVGKLPPGWKRRTDALAFVYSIDGIPHAYVQLVRQRVNGAVDVAAQLRKRETHYRFPGLPPETEGLFREARWAGHAAQRYSVEGRLGTVVCRRRVTAFFARSNWYELIETSYGETTDDLPEVRDGFALFRDGFALLTETVPAEQLGETAARSLHDPTYGYRILKPEGFVRVEADPGRDNGCRLAFERRGPPKARTARVRLFEFGVRPPLDADEWLKIFFSSYAAQYEQARREKQAAPVIPGTSRVVEELFTGIREKIPVRTRVLLIQSVSGRVFCLRIRTQADADHAFADGLAQVTAQLAFE